MSNQSTKEDFTDFTLVLSRTSFFTNIRRYAHLPELNIAFLNVLLVGAVTSQGLKDMERLQGNAK
jgi:hypothetical protein